jgi:hypothetical protein
MRPSLQVRIRSQAGDRALGAAAVRALIEPWVAVIMFAVVLGLAVAVLFDAVTP